MKVLRYIILLFIISIWSAGCKNKKEPAKERILTIITEINKSDKTSQVININLDTGDTTGLSIDNYFLSSAVYSEYYKALGYCDDNNVYHFVKNNGEEIFELHLPWPLVMVAIDDNNHWLMGMALEDVIKFTVIDLDKQSVILQRALSTSYMFPVCSYTYNPDDTVYYTFAQTSDGNEFILSIKANDGQIINRATPQLDLKETIYNKSNKTIIGLYTTPDRTFDIVCMNPVDGQTVSQAHTSLKAVMACIVGFDYTNNYYITLNSTDEGNIIVFIDPATGTISRSINVSQRLLQIIYHEN